MNLLKLRNFQDKACLVPSQCHSLPDRTVEINGWETSQMIKKEDTVTRKQNIKQSVMHTNLLVHKT